MEGRRVHEVFPNFQTSTTKSERGEENGNQLSQREVEASSALEGSA